MTDNSENEILSESEEEELHNWENMKLKSGNYLTRLAPRTDSSDTLLKKLRASLFTSESETLKGLEKERGFLEQSF